MEDRSWMSLRRTCAEYLNGLKLFIGAAKEDMLNQSRTTMLCPCIDCKNEKQYSSSSLVHGHLIMRGFMANYRCWTKHGKGVNDGDFQAGSELEDLEQIIGSEGPTASATNESDADDLDEGDAVDPAEPDMRDALDDLESFELANGGSKTTAKKRKDGVPQAPQEAPVEEGSVLEGGQ